MERKIIFLEPESGEELVLPVTPKGYEIEHGRKVESLTMHTVGDVTAPGAAVLLDQELECLFPAQAYPFAQPGAGTDPFRYVEKFEKWSDAGKALRFIVSDTPVNALVLLGPIRYREQDGTNDIYCTIPIRGYRQLAAEAVENRAAARAVEAPPVRPETYTVVWGDTMGAICRRFYGDASLAPRLAAYNGIKNVNLIHPGQVLKLPDVSQLPKAATKKSGTVSAAKAEEKQPVQLKVVNGRGVMYAGPIKVGYQKGREHGVAAGRSLEAALAQGDTVGIRWDLTGVGKVSYVLVNGKTVKPQYSHVDFVVEKDTEVELVWWKK